MLNVRNMIKGTKFEGAYEISKILKDNGFQCYVVGGIVRDLLLYKTIDDDSEWDLATDAKPKKYFKFSQKKGLRSYL
jgi:tRNA nucleotidyltransferase/poly(A) polymerase